MAEWFHDDFASSAEKADKLKALAHPVRLCIVRGLLESGSCNVTYMQGCLNLPQSTISQHLAKLRAARLIEGVRNGLEVYYRVIDDDVIRLVATLFDNSSHIDQARDTVRNTQESLAHSSR